MPRIVRSPRSREDVIEIGSFIARDNVDAALRLADGIDKTLRLLSEFPTLGQRREDLLAGLRSLPVGNYLVFYRPLEDGIEVVRILHGSRDLRKAIRGL